jgi:tetratricopeptide (TPR) repeat protein
MAESIRDVWILRYVRRVEAEAALIGRAPNDALAAFEGMFEGSPLEARNVSFLLPTLAWALLANNRLDEAQATATEAVKRCREEPNLDDLPDALRIAGMVAAAAGRVDEARGHFEEALAVTKQMETPYSGARALYEYGRMLAQQGDAGGARERFQAALSIFERLGARPYIESTRAALEALATA